MRRRLPRTLALPVSVALLLLSAAPALAQTLPTTPIPLPASAGQPPASAPSGPQALGHAVGQADTALGVLRLLPNSVTTSSIFPGYSETLPKQSALEAGMGLSSAQANSESYLSYERSIAQASPFGLAAGGNAPQTPGSLVQTALPDNPQPVTGGLNFPPNPLLNVGLLNGMVHARWSPTLGPCVDTISDASTSVASLSLLNMIPGLPNLPLSGLNLDPKTLAGGFDLTKGLQGLGGLLQGGGQASSDGTGSVLSLPNTLSSRSQVKLVDIPGSKNKALQSISTMQAASISLFKGTPLELSIDVASQPTLKVTSTGDAKTSKVEYTAPVLQVKRGDTVLYTLDAAHPTADIPVGLPLAPLTNMFPGGVSSLPVVGGLVSTLHDGVQKLASTTGNVLDLGVIRLGIAELTQKAQQTGTPFAGYNVGAVARLLDLQVLPTERLKSLLPSNLAGRLPSSLAQLTLGEQMAIAEAPAGGVQCGSTAPASPPAGGAQPQKLAYTSGAYSAVPMFWSGTAMLLVGVLLVAAMPSRRRRATASTAQTVADPGPAPEPPSFKPSPRTRQ